MTQNILSTLIPLMDVNEPEAVDVFKSFLVFEITEKHNKICFTVPIQPVKNKNISFKIINLFFNMMIQKTNIINHTSANYTVLFFINQKC